MELMCFTFALQFAGCKEKLLDLLDAYVKMLGGGKVIQYAPDIKVHSICARYQGTFDMRQISRYIRYAPDIKVHSICARYQGTFDMHQISRYYPSFHV